MRGQITDSREAVFPLQLIAANGKPVKIEAILDTGFDDCLTLPPDVVRSMRLPYIDTIRGYLADGNLIDLDVHRATILWHGSPRIIPIQVADTDPLMGMTLLLGSRVTLDVVDGGEATIAPL